MIYLITALYHEARPLIRTLSLKAVQAIHTFPCYQDDERRYTLVISGTGKAAAAAAVGSACTFFGVSDSDFLILTGTSAVIREPDHPGKSSLFLCHKIRDLASHRVFYPDMLLASGLNEAACITVDRVLQPEDAAALKKMAGDDGEERVLADMEASAVWEAGMYFFAPHRIVIAKAVSDDGNGRSVTAGIVEQTMVSCLPEMEKLLASVTACSEVLRQRQGDTEDESALFEKLSADLHCSETMRIRLRQLIRYSELEAIDLEQLLAAEGITEDLPCRDRREGKKILEKIRDKLL